MEFTQEVKQATNSIYQKISKVVPEIEWASHAPYIHEINKLKKKKMQLFLHIIIKHLKFIMVFQTLPLTLLLLQLRHQKHQLI